MPRTPRPRNFQSATRSAWVVLRMIDDDTLTVKGEGAGSWVYATLTRTALQTSTWRDILGEDADAVEQAGATQALEERVAWLLKGDETT